MSISVSSFQLLLLPINRQLRLDNPLNQSSLSPMQTLNPLLDEHPPLAHSLPTSQNLKEIASR
jgi:hypothetical protein